MNRAFLALAALTLGFSAAAQTLVTTGQLDQLAGEDHHTLIQQWLVLDADAIELKLQVYPRARQAWLRKLLIERLGRQDSPTEQQRRWVAGQTDSEHILKAHVPDSGHELPISVLNIPAQARGLLAHWSSIEAADGWLEALERKRFSWQQVFEQMTTLNRRQNALSHFLARLPGGQTENLANDLLAQKQGAIDVPNQVLYLLARATSDSFQKAALYQWLWAKPMDEHSVAAMHHLVEGPGNPGSIPLLQQAVKNQGLASLALNLMAQHYADQPHVVDYLFARMSMPGYSALAGAALAKIDSADVKSRLEQGIYSPDKLVSKASRLALSLIKAKE